MKDVSEIGRAHAARGVQMLTNAGKYTEALEAVKNAEPLLSKPAQKAELGAVVYDGWGRRLVAEKKWQAAMEKYAEGLKAYPGQARLTTNAAVAADQWPEPP